MPGPPLSPESNIAVLIKHNITVGLGVPEAWMARNTGFDLAWAGLESGTELTHGQVTALATMNLEKLLGVEAEAQSDLVATVGGDLFEFSKVAAVMIPNDGVYLM
jgi:hypothetical protein